MKYVYDYVQRCGDKELLSHLNCAASRLHQKFQRIDLRDIHISDYNRRYLGGYLANIVGTLQRYTYLLSLILEGREIPIEDFVLVDYGGGSGILTFLAKEAGVGRVIYNDIYEVSCKDVKVLSKVLQLQVYDYVCGDIDDLIPYVRNNAIFINAIGSYDVIEHIYDIETYLRKMAHLSNQSFRMVHASAANTANPAIVWRLRKFHMKYEYENRDAVWGWKERDTLKNYRDSRREIIAERAPEIGQDEVEMLVRQTLGLAQDDICKCVDEYRENGFVSYTPKDKTSTCDPYTGNWAEHLMDISWLKGILIEEGFEVDLRTGYWRYQDSVLRNIIAVFLNKCIEYFRGSALRFSPYFVLCANHKPAVESA